MQLQRVCHNTLPWLISFSLDDCALIARLLRYHFWGAALARGKAVDIHGSLRCGAAIE
jgi:hypothetical protein